MLFGASSEPLAVFSADGALLCTNSDLAPGTTLESLGANSERLGSGGNTVLLVLLPHERAQARAEQATEQAEEVEARAEEMPSSQTIEEPPAPSIAEEQPAPEPEDQAEEIPASPAAERPLRFVWTMDADERFNLAAPTFADAMGPRTADAIGKPWREIAAELGLDAEGRFANAVAARDTFSGIVLAWPGASGPVSVELSGLADLRSRAHLQGLSRLRRVPRRRTRRHRRHRLHSPSKQRLLRPHQQSRRRSRSVRSSRSCRRRRTWCRFRAPPTNALPFRRSSARPSWRSARP